MTQHLAFINYGGVAPERDGDILGRQYYRENPWDREQCYRTYTQEGLERTKICCDGALLHMECGWWSGDRAQLQQHGYTHGMQFAVSPIAETDSFRYTRQQELYFWRSSNPYKKLVVYTNGHPVRQPYVLPTNGPTHDRYDLRLSRSDFMRMMPLIADAHTIGADIAFDNSATHKLQFQWLQNAVKTTGMSPQIWTEGIRADGNYWGPEIALARSLEQTGLGEREVPDGANWWAIISDHKLPNGEVSKYTRPEELRGLKERGWNFITFAKYDELVANVIEGRLTSGLSS